MECGDSPGFTFCDDDNRAYIEEYSDPGQFYVGDRVFLVISHPDGTKSHEGPYVIESVCSGKRYTLCHPNGQSVRAGTTIEEKDLEPASS
ncbi:uncharacterized protein APUU_61150A [Aspergillus puulaauensis]|uniref:Uncharacterized protein n=1 Tax=Aspergillus puulaauensis TaxID=1220207 RepID=A0A7R7XUR2_9EURO|nr:uncharacterized protein APUU_61150A [Aspergillus puulaauensis]BCS28102.1 hypothetical protein APUU_61150A [Aspergillus puulaauensis]